MLARLGAAELFVTQCRDEGRLATRVYFSRPRNIIFFYSHDDVRGAFRRWQWLLTDYIKGITEPSNDTVPDTRLHIMDWLSECSDTETASSDTESEATTSTAERESREEEMSVLQDMELSGWRPAPDGYQLRRWVQEPRDLAQELTTSQLNLFQPGTGWSSVSYDVGDLMEIWRFANLYAEASYMKGNVYSIFAWMIRYHLT